MSMAAEADVLTICQCRPVGINSSNSAFTCTQQHTLFFHSLSLDPFLSIVGCIAMQQQQKQQKFAVLLVAAAEAAAVVVVVVVAGVVVVVVVVVV